MHSPLNITAALAQSSPEADKMSSTILQILTSPEVFGAGLLSYRVYQEANAMIADVGIRQAIGRVRRYNVSGLFGYTMVHLFDLPVSISQPARDFATLLCICLLYIHFIFVTHERRMGLSIFTLLPAIVSPAYAAKFLFDQSFKILGCRVTEDGIYFCLACIVLYFLAWATHGREFAVDQPNGRNDAADEGNVAGVGSNVPALGHPHHY